MFIGKAVSGSVSAPLLVPVSVRVCELTEAGDDGDGGDDDDDGDGDGDGAADGKDGARGGAMTAVVPAVSARHGSRLIHRRVD